MGQPGGASALARARCRTKGSSGKWVARRYLGGGQYKVETIGVADDHSDANGADILNFFQAQRRARDVAAKAKVPPGSGDFTVAAALTAYFARLEHEGSKSLAAARGTARLHILPDLGATPIAGLTRDGIARWLTGLAGKAKNGDPDAQGNREPHPNHSARGSEPGLSRRQSRNRRPLADGQAI
jgi:hypothetical protein